jgi:hypothetical protein
MSKSYHRTACFISFAILAACGEGSTRKNAAPVPPVAAEDPFQIVQIDTSPLDHGLGISINTSEEQPHNPATPPRSHGRELPCSPADGDLSGMGLFVWGTDGRSLACRRQPNPGGLLVLPRRGNIYCPARAAAVHRGIVEGEAAHSRTVVYRVRRNF